MSFTSESWRGQTVLQSRGSSDLKGHGGILAWTDSPGSAVFSRGDCGTWLERSLVGARRKSSYKEHRRRKAFTKRRLCPAQKRELNWFEFYRSGVNLAKWIQHFAPGEGCRARTMHIRRTRKWGSKLTLDHSFYNLELHAGWSGNSRCFRLWQHTTNITDHGNISSKEIEK